MVAVNIVKNCAAVPRPSLPPFSGVWSALQTSVTMAATSSYYKLLQVLLFTTLCYCSSGDKQSNIILLLTDDQDLVLGGLTPLAYTKDLMETKGATLSNFFVNTPVCCPSRTTLITGMYPHNWHTIHGGCMHMNVTNEHFEKSSIGVKMQALNYRTGMFGKLLNPGGVSPYCSAKAEERKPLPGFDDYMTMCNDNRYFKNVFTMPDKIYTSGTEPEDYLTSLIGNATVKFVEDSLKSNKPFFAYVAPHAPHVPATPAPWYQDVFADKKAPRTPNYNYSALDHHYVIRSQPPLTAKIANESDELFQNRWRSLLSVDDITRALVPLLQKYNALDNTYILLTSDHGFNLGQLRLPSCKLQPYDHDIRVPFQAYGPGIAAGSKFDFVAGMVDVAPTLISLGGGTPPSEMDGRSFADILMHKPAVPLWTDRHMIEYWSLGNVIRYEHYIDMPNNTYLGVRLLNSTHNYLYAEFFDGENVVDFSDPLEYELFDVTADPYQMKNIYGTKDADEDLVKELKEYIHKQYKCAGKDCA